MLVNELGIFMEVKLVQAENAFVILITESGILTEVKLLQPENA